MELKIKKALQKCLKYEKIDVFIEVITYILIAISFVIYEFGFCNSNFILQKAQFNFSLCRILFYCVVIALFSIFKKKFTKEAIEALVECKFKCYTLVTYFFVLIAVIIFFIIRINYISLTKLSLYSLLLIAGVLCLIYIQKKQIKNIIIVAFTFGLICSISMDLNHPYDESRHMVSAYNVSIGNFDYENFELSNKLLKVPLDCKQSEISELYSIRFGNEVNSDVDKSNIAFTPAPYNFLLYSFSGTGMFLARFLRRKYSRCIYCGKNI